MSDEAIPIGTAEPICGECGAKLLIEHDGAELKGDERLICPTHGDQGSLQDFREMAGKQAAETVSDMLRDALKKGSFDPH